MGMGMCVSAYIECGWHATVLWCPLHLIQPLGEKEIEHESKGAESGLTFKTTII